MSLTLQLRCRCAASADPANFTDRGTSWTGGGGIRVGYFGRLSDALSIGAFYQSKLWTGRFRKYAGLFAGQGGFDAPASWGAGVALRVTPALTLAGDVKRIEYSGVKSIANPLAQLFQGIPFGATDGPGFGWRDITVYKVGVSYTASSQWVLRAGYGRSGNPVRRSQTFLNILAPGVVQDHFTLGATWTAPSGLEVTGYAMRAPRNRVQGSGSIPASFGGGEADVYLAETSVGIGFGKHF
ncbi:porin [Sphingomonadaceae bacterium jetA1]|uniref:OmpP1/FadL family transporter n=1 Tax=Facivitalis istanbulensis TaxID=3075838 RepID=UPI0034812FD2